MHVTIDPSSALNDFRSLYVARGPKWHPSANEALPIGSAMLLPPAPATGVSLGWPRESDSDPGIHTYIWVIDDSGIPHIKDVKLDELGGYCPRHTNLTAGGKAYVGGELWFESHDTLWISGSSGRYHPISEVQLGDSVKVFKDFGYSVHSLGWDSEVGRANRFLGDL